MPKAKPALRSFQERFERTLVGRILISAFVLLTLLSVLTANLPDSRLKSLLNSAVHPYLYGAALDQSWSVFAPDPRRETIQIAARVTYADGSNTTWRVPKWDPVFGAYADYRWLKWAEYIVSPAYTELWRPAALYVAREKASPTHRPVRVSLANRWYDLLPPGQIHQRRFVHERPFFTTQVTEAMLREGGG